MPFRIALSGLAAASTDLKTTGNNIANASTTGFKESRTEFADLFASSITDVGATTSGNGVRVSRVAQQFAQGSIDFTDSALDMAINGEGFFVVRAGDGTLSYTRAGAFALDRDGSVVDHAGKYLQVFTPLTTAIDTGFQTVPSNLSLPTGLGAPSATGVVSVSLNLDAREVGTVAAFDPLVSSTYEHSTSTSIYDSLGIAHTSTMFYKKSAAVVGDWDVYLYVDNTPITIGAAPNYTMQFDSSGDLVTPAAPGQITYDTINAAVIPTWEGADMDLTFAYGDTTQYGTNFGVNNMTQDGYTSGQLSGMDIDKTGVVFARFTNGESEILGKVAMARFNNPQGMRQLGDTSWSETFTSGSVQYGEAGSASFGLIQSGALEGSNVDIAAQLVNLITAQRNFQANSQVIKVGDTVTQTIINIR